ncbi:phasin (plasmid) [Rhizobium sp. Pop5]|nr:MULTISPECIES: phasin [Rhizobium]MDK4729007.1 phasin [Rhizobium phaseoli]NKE90970.1 phasin [Rhizobium phaseoli]PCD63935.1 phasin [Rhizobium phaseoli]PWI50769.1 phasin [Rhizobium phaseoli]UVD54728.1 phasin [Rhizobium sp. Pop5]
MTKISERSFETIENPGSSSLKVPDQFAASVEKGNKKVTEAFLKFASGAEATQKMLPPILETTSLFGNELWWKTIAALQADAEASFSHLQALLGANSPSQILEQQSTFFRKRVETSLQHAKEVRVLSSRAVEEISKPVKDAFDKVLTDLKAT